MKEIDINNLGILNNQLAQYEDIMLKKSGGKPGFKSGYTKLEPIKLNHWWGKTYLHYDKAQQKLYTESLNWVGVLCHKLFGYRKDLNRNNLWEFFKDRKIVTADSKCPSKSRFNSIVRNQFLSIAQKQDKIREYFEVTGRNSKLSLEEKKSYFTKQGLDVNVKDDRGATALYRASESEDIELVHYLLSRGAEVNTSCPNAGQVFERAFDCAVYKRILPMVDAFLNTGVDIDAKGYQGRTPIFYAIGSEAQSPLINSRDPEKHDRPNQLLLIEKLLAKDPNLNILDVHGKSPLCYAVQTQDKEIISRLIDKGANVNGVETKESNSTTHWQISQISPLCEAIITGNPEIINLLFDRGAVIKPEESKVLFDAWSNSSKSQVILDTLRAKGLKN